MESGGGYISLVVSKIKPLLAARPPTGQLYLHLACPFSCDSKNGSSLPLKVLQPLGKDVCNRTTR